MLLKEYMQNNDNIFVFPFANNEMQAEYDNNKNIINVVMKNKYGTLPLVSEDENEISDLIQGILFVNQYKIVGLWDSTKFEYEPLFNVEENTTVTSVYGARNETSIYGERNETSTYGEQNHTENTGESTDTNTFGAKENTETNSVFPYDESNNAKNTDRKITSSEGYEDTVVNGAVEITRKEEAHTDTRKEEEKTDTHTSTEYTDTVTTERSGNIGVTSTQELIQQQRKVVDFSFWNAVIDIVCREITIPYYERIERSYGVTNWLY